MTKREVLHANQFWNSFNAAEEGLEMEFRSAGLEYFTHVVVSRSCRCAVPRWIRRDAWFLRTWLYTTQRGLWHREGHWYWRGGSSRCRSPLFGSAPSRRGNRLRSISWRQIESDSRKEEIAI